ncbi:MAG TPA: hypothetical protein VIE35_15970, partial [Dongiaceae bacterium]
MNLRRSRHDRAPYTIWRDQGLLIATEGNTTDFKTIEAEILELAARFKITELAYHRTFAGEIVRNLQDEGLSLVEFGQGFFSMGPAGSQGAESVYESIAAAAATIRKESGNRAGAASLR